MSKIKDYIILETDEFEKKHVYFNYDSTILVSIGRSGRG